jgi:hypothetical protein
VTVKNVSNLAASVQARLQNHARATKDLDFLGRLDNSLENLERVVREVCSADVEPDGMVFDPATVKTERIKEDADYEGVPDAGPRRTGPTSSR